MDERDNPQVESEQTEHERRVAEVEETERGESDVDPVAGSDRRPTAEEDLAADRDEPIDEEDRGWQHQPPEDLGR
jgi:hypothetical protein